MYCVRLAGYELTFETAPALFSPDRLDAGTAAMLRAVQFESADKVLDLCCGYGPVGVYAGKLIDPARVWLLDNDPLAVGCASRNLERNGVAGAHVQVDDGFASLEETAFTKILCNPPYHADFALPKIEKAFNRLAVGGALWMVVRREAWYRRKLRAIFGAVTARPDAGYVIFEAVKTSSRYANRPD